MSSLSNIDHAESPLSEDEVAGVIRTSLRIIANHGTPNIDIVKGITKATAYVLACVIRSTKSHEHAEEMKAEIFELLGDEVDAILRSRADA